MSKSDPEAYTEAETKARAEAALKRMLATPHKPHSDMKTPARPKPRRVNSGQKKGEKG